MKRKFGLLLATASLFALTSCGFLEGIREQIGGELPAPTVTAPTVKPNDNIPNVELTDPANPGRFTITYDFNNGSIGSCKVASDNKALKPADPKKIAASFIEWCSDEELTKPFDFNTPVHKDTTIYAKFNIDYAELTNELSGDEIKGTIRIKGKFKKGAIIQESLGSGTIIKLEGDYYYAITNNHVVYQPKDTKLEGYTVTDCYLNEYKADVLNSSAEYDLALIRFKKNPKVTNLPVIELAEDNLSKNEPVIAVGNPLGQNNVITYGKAIDSDNIFKPNPDTIFESNVQFAVINHSAFINSGSSGGALFDTNLHLIGVNFASSTSIDSHEFLYSHAIPLNKVHEFLNACDFSFN